MKKILLGMAAVSALAIGAPAAAQFSNGYQNGYQTRGYVNTEIGARVQQLRIDIQTGAQRGTLSRQEAVRLDQQAIQLIQIERQYSRNGLSGRERGDLMQRLNNLRQQIRYAERTGNGRYDRDDRFGDRDGRFGRNDRWEDDRRDRDGRYDRNGRWEDRNDRYEDRDRRWNERTGRWEDRDDRYEDRDRRWNERTGRWEDRDDRYEDRDRRYEPQQRGGIGGIIGSILGVNTGLRVGQRATGNLYGLPYEYRNRFRDGNGVYYRTDGRMIYQIDARTDTVVRIYAMNR